MSTATNTQITNGKINFNQGVQGFLKGSLHNQVLGPLSEFWSEPFLIESHFIVEVHIED